jgi:hypothetical protein
LDPVRANVSWNVGSPNAALKASTDSHTATLRNVEFSATPRWSWVEMNPGVALR